MLNSETFFLCGCANTCPIRMWRILLKKRKKLSEATTAACCSSFFPTTTEIFQLKMLFNPLKTIKPNETLYSSLVEFCKRLHSHLVFSFVLSASMFLEREKREKKPEPPKCSEKLCAHVKGWEFERKKKKLDMHGSNYERRSVFLFGEFCFVYARTHVKHAHWKFGDLIHYICVGLCSEHLK